MHYKISEVSKILNIPIDTLRYYEKEGIIQPQKFENSKYRYYDAWDINFLLDYKYYRSLEFSLAEVRSIQQDDDLPAFTNRMNDQISLFLWKKKYYAMLSERYIEKFDSVNSIQQNLNQCLIKKLEDTSYFIHRYNYKYEMKDASGGLFDNWLSYYPFIENMIRVKDTEIGFDNDEYEWGFAVQNKWKTELELLSNNHVVCVKETMVIYTIVQAGDKGSYSNSLLKHVTNYARENNLEICGDAMGFLLARVHEANGFARYIEFYIPIKEK